MRHRLGLAATTQPAFLFGITHIIELRPDNKMRGIDAGRIVTRMQNNETHRLGSTYGDLLEIRERKEHRAMQ
jgi:hypothetical protein